MMGEIGRTDSAVEATDEAVEAWLNSAALATPKDSQKGLMQLCIPFAMSQIAMIQQVELPISS